MTWVHGQDKIDTERIGFVSLNNLGLPFEDSETNEESF